MSEEEKENKPAVCENFEPQAWRKICKNCFQPPENHEYLNGTHGTGDEKHEDKSRSVSPSKKGSAATSIKDKYEQMEREKDMPKDLPHTLPRTKGKGGLASLTGMYNDLEVKAGKVPGSPSGNIPPPVFPKTFKKDGALQKSKFGSMENINSNEKEPPTSLGAKNKFGSMDNISIHDKKKDGVIGVSLKIGQQKDTSGQNKGKHDLLSKLDSFQNELKTGAASKAGPTVIHKQKDGKVDIINLPPKDAKDTKTSLSKTETKDTKAKEPEKDDKDIKSKSDLKSRFDSKLSSNESNSIKSPRDLLSPPRKLDSKLDKENEEASSKKGLLPKSQDQLKSVSHEKDVPTKLNTNKFNFKNQLKSPSPEKDKSILDTNKDSIKSPTVEKSNLSWKDKLKSSKDTTRDDLKSPTPDKDKKPDFKLKSAQDEKPSPASALKNQLKSNQTSTETQDKNAPNKLLDLKGQLKSKSQPDKTAEPVKDNKKTSNKDSLKRDDKTSELKSKFPDLKGSSKSLQKEEPIGKEINVGNKNKLTSLKDRLKSPDAVDEKKEEKKVAPVVDTKKGTFNLKDQLKSSKPDKEKEVSKEKEKDHVSVVEKKGFSFKDQLKSKTDTDLKPEKKGNILEKRGFGVKLDEKSKPEEKAKDVKFGLKKPTDDDKKTDSKNKFELPKLKSKDSLSSDNKRIEIPKLKSKSEIAESTSKQASEETKPLYGKAALKSHDKNVEDKPIETKTTHKESSGVRDIRDSNQGSETKPLFRKTESEKAGTKVSDIVKDSQNEKDTKPLFGKSLLKSKDQTDSPKNEEDKSNTKLLKTNSTSKAEISESKTDLSKDTEKTRSLGSEKGTKTDVDKTPQKPDISDNTFDIVSTDINGVSSERSDTRSYGDIGARDKVTARDRSPVHVDTQVFTSSRSSTAGGGSLTGLGSLDSSGASKIADISGLEFHKSKSPLSDSGIGGEHITQNGDSDVSVDVSASFSLDGRPSVAYSDDEVKKLKEELLNMTERCQNLEKENELLSDGLKKKESSATAIQKEKESVDETIRTLKDQLQSMQTKCNKLESDNTNLLNDIKLRQDAITSADSKRGEGDGRSDDAPEVDERCPGASGRLVEAMEEENEALKEEIRELKLEMEEMYDSFRDQEAEEFREMQKVST